MAGRTRKVPTGGGGGGGDDPVGGDGSPRDPGNPQADQCNLYFTTPLQGADPAVVATLTPGAEVNVEVQPGAPFPSVICRVRATGQIAGSLAGADELIELIACSADGHRYRGQVVGAQSPPLIRVYRSQRPSA
ncbi:hypothetical protein J2X65_004281 [Ancylobacter sp. 3268]|uniref:hypothetical protein n=1 Tax=Ancylobacter sp. 3268 TaxID=2817752 RepID=UPI00285D1006|nr:hypothetical protein [Ancylobacter sp. 3268]MDR6954905.1 hypothetical protein [Ancylobacter sp. 3268]